MNTGCRSAGQNGFTYLAVLLMVAIISAGLGATGQVWSTVQQREREKELLFIGNQYRDAIRRYWEGSPGPARQFPRTLEDLLQDKRYPAVRRYLRRAYRDPMTGTTDWGIVRGPDGGIAGVFSKSEAAPLKRVGFAARDMRFEGTAQYKEWIFMYEGQPPTPTIPPPRGTPQEGGSMFPQE